ncbi:MAG: hypothetical protein JW928_02760, partial [Candidatus Aureabacteria bacterium]|nr:hypothetical protein [Candidatus Auribacterota bacterium]
MAIRLSLVFIVIFYIFITPQAVPADLEGMETIAFETFLFDEIIYAESTTKREEKAGESALNVRVITREDIENYGIENLQQLMLFLENTFESMKGRDRVYGVRGIMGYANDKIKFLIDGMELPMELG